MHFFAYKPLGILLNLFSYPLAKKEWRITVPTLFTILRIILVPWIVATMVEQQWGLSFYLFIAAAGTDMIDGALARLCNAKTFLGACLDALADKLLLISCFATLAFVHSPLFSIPRWFVFLVLIKELVMIGGSFVVYLMKGFIEIKPTLLGKMTTFVQICFIVWLFSCYFFKWLPVKTYFFMLGLLTVLSVACLLHYILIAIRFVRTPE